MAPIPASITVNFNSNYAGSHRVCWRSGGSGPYDCTTIVTCPIGPCSAVINIMVDNETCDEVVFDGYVQATCQDPASLTGRVPFDDIFTPVPTCISYNIICETAGIESIDITNPGSTYNPALPPIALISGDGSGATVGVTIGDGGVKTETITNGGSGYNGGGTGTFTNVPGSTLTGVGTGVTYDVTVTLGVVTAIVLSSGPTAPGINYVVNDTFTFLAVDLGGTGSGAVITVNSLNTGEVQYVTVITPGSGYTLAAITFPAPSGGGVTATGIVNLAPCPPLDYGINCNGDAYPVIPDIEVGQNFNVCYNTTPPILPAGYNRTPQGCCYDCVDVTISKPGIPASSAVLYYTTCEGDTIGLGITEGFAVTDCMLNNSWIIVQETGTTNVVVGAACP